MSEGSTTEASTDTAVSERDPVKEVLERLTLGDWVRIWFTALPRHMPRRLATEVQFMGTEVAMRGLMAGTILAIPMGVVIYFVLPDTPAARTWPLLVVPAYIYLFVSNALVYWMKARDLLTTHRYNVLMMPAVISMGLVWGTMPAAFRTDEIGLFYVAVIVSTVVSVLGTNWMGGHWFLATIYSATIAGLTGYLFYHFNLPERGGAAALSVIHAIVPVVITAFDCPMMVRANLQTVITKDRQEMIDLLLHGYARGGNDWVWEVDENSTFQSIPPRMLVAARGDPRIAPGIDLASLVANDETARAAIAESDPFETTIITEGDEGQGEIRLWGQPKIINDTCLGYQGVGSDLGSAKRAAEAQRTSERYDAMVSVTSGINHDFNNQLATVLGAVELARLSVQESDDAVTYLDRAVEACMRSRSLTADLSAALGLQSSAEAVPFDLTEETRKVIEDVSPLYASMAIDLQSFGEVPVVGDPHHLRRAIRNLVENACQANSQHEDSTNKVKVTVSTGQPDNVAKGTIRVRDDGPGVSDDVADRIFEPFFTTRRSDGGTGLGLAVAQGLCRQAGGSLRLEPSERGASFVLQLPLARSAVIDRNRAEADADASHQLLLRRGNYLILEDDDLVAATLVDWVESRGGTATWIETVAEGLTLAHRDAFQFVCLISDIVLPDGEGFEVVAAFREPRPKIPAVYVSGFSKRLPKDLEASLHGPFVSKPFTSTELLHALGAVGMLHRSS